MGWIQKYDIDEETVVVAAAMVSKEDLETATQVPEQEEMEQRDRSTDG
jgi:hypothetical protein